MREHRHDVEYSRRHDGKFNVWVMTDGVDGGWTIVAVYAKQHEALDKVREMRAERRTQ